MKQKKEPFVRFSISLSPQLLKQLDAMMVDKGRENRSQLISEMIRNQLVEHQAEFSLLIFSTTDFSECKSRPI